jgi:hypothetical protein
MTDVTKYKSIAIPLDTYEQITKVAQKGFDVPMSRSKAVQHIFNIWTGNITPKPKHIADTVDDSTNHLNSYRYYAENKR